MLLEVVFVHFSFLSASLADVPTKVVNHPNTKAGYASEWQFRENFVGTGLAYDPNLKSTTTEKVIQYASGWRPIASSRNVFRDREARSGNQHQHQHQHHQHHQRQHHHYGTVVQIGGRRDKKQPLKSWKRSPNRVQHEYSSSSSIDSTPKMLPFPAATTRNQAFPFSFVGSMIPNATNILPQIRHNSYPIERATNTVENFRPPPLRQYDLDRKKKSKPVMKEDDIVWMHYNSFDQVPKALPFVSNDLPEVRQLDQYDTDMLMQETQDNAGPFVVYSSSTGIAQPTKTSTDEDDDGASTMPTTPRPYHSRSSYEIIDKNNKDNFKPMTTTTTQRVIEEGTTTKMDEESWPNFHDVFYGAVDDTMDERRATERHLVPGQFSSPRPSAETQQQTSKETRKEAYEYADDSESGRNRRLFNLTTKSENISSQEYAWTTRKSTSNKPTDDDKVPDDERGKMSTKFFAKPIVITETAPEDEYFKRLLYDSFGDSVPNDTLQAVDGNANAAAALPNTAQRSDENEIKDDATAETIERTDNEVLAADDPAAVKPTEMKSLRAAGNFSEGDEYKLDEVVVKKKVRANNDATWNFLLNVTEGLQFADLIPVTLKTNMFLVKKLIVECYSDADETDSRGSTINCLKKITFKVLDRAVESDVVKITDSVSLVKDNNTAVDRFSRSFSDDSANWFSCILEKLQKLFSTHSLKVKLVNPRETENFQVEGRRRHRFRRVFPVVAGIYMTITAVVIPIVFQFMAMMGGKSFVISKLALLFALFSSFSKFFTPPADNNHHHQHSLPLPPPPPPPLPPLPYPHYHYDHPVKRKSDKRFKRIPVDYNYSYYLVD